MKMFYRLFLAASAMMLAFACQRELPSPVDEDAGRKVVALQDFPVALSSSLDGEEQDTKSLINIDSDFLFNEAYLFCFVHGGTNNGKIYLGSDGNPVAMRSTSKSFSWSLPIGSSYPMDLYVVVNPDESSASTLSGYLTNKNLKVSDLQSLTFVCESVVTTRDLNEKGLPMTAVNKGSSGNGLVLTSASDEVTIRLKRLFARYDIRLDLSLLTSSGQEVELQQAYANGNTRVSYFYSGSGAGVAAQSDQLALLDLASSTDIATLNDIGTDKKSKNAISLYLLENCQGNKGPASKWSNVYPELGSAVENCSYLEFVVGVSDDVTGTVERMTYRLYPGQNSDMKSNFDIVRNNYKKVLLKLDPAKVSTGFHWQKSQLNIAKGESKTVYFETTLGPGEVKISSNNPNIRIPSEFTVVAKSTTTYGTPQTSMPYNGFVTVQALSSSVDDEEFSITGGNEDGTVMRKLPGSVNDSESVFNGVSVTREAAYRGQWMVIQLNEDVHTAGNMFGASITTYEKNSSGKYVAVSGVGDHIDISRTSDGFGSNGKTGILKNHIWYDKTTNRLHVYPFVRRNCADKSYVELRLTVEDDSSGEAETLGEKVFTLNPKELYLRGSQDITQTELVATVYYSPSGYTQWVMDCLYLVDKDLNKVIDNSTLEWGGGFTGVSNAPYRQSTPGFFKENLLIESSVEVEYPDEDNPFDGHFEFCDDLVKYRDYAAWDFDIYTIEIFYKHLTDPSGFDYDPDVYATFYHSYFGGYVDIFPTAVYRDNSYRNIKILEPAIGNPEDGDYMEASSKEVSSGTSFYLMYGLKRYYYIQMENIPVTPTVTLSIPTSQAPYVKTNLVLVDSARKLYRLDVTLNSYTSPLTYNSSAKPYSSSGGMDTSAGDKSVTITISASYYGTSYSKQLVCKTLGKRFGLELQNAGREINMAMWNPFGFDFDFSVSASVSGVVYRQAWHGVWEWFWDGYQPTFPSDEFYTEIVTGSRIHESQSYSQVKQLGVANLAESTSASHTGLVATNITSSRHPEASKAPNTEQGLIFFPRATIQSGNAELRIDNDFFRLTERGYVFAGSPLRILNCISVSSPSGGTVSLNYTYSTLVNYGLQTNGPFQNYDYVWYLYYFQSPAMFKEYNSNWRSLTLNDPEHIGGSDRQESFPFSLSFRSGGTTYSNGSYQANNPVCTF